MDRTASNANCHPLALRDALAHEGDAEMSLDITLLEVKEISVFDANITHNLAAMAEEAGIYQVLWKGPENSVVYAHQLIGPLEAALQDLRANQKKYQKLNPVNGWGSYEGFVSWLEELYTACVNNKHARIEVSR